MVCSLSMSQLIVNVSPGSLTNVLGVVLLGEESGRGLEWVEM